MFSIGNFKIRLKFDRFSFWVFLLTILFCLPLISLAFVFEGTVAEGEENLSIKNLQVILNQDPRTQVAEVGAGAPGLETSFFGARTRGALARFQHLNGISGEYGFVGPKTRLALNKKLAETYFSETSTSTNKISNKLIETKKSFTFRLPSGVRGKSTSLAEKKSPYVKRLEKAKKSAGSTKKTEVVGKPKISALSPTRGTYGTRVTIKGENFTATGNTIYTGYGVLKNVSSSDKKTLTFIARAFEQEYQQSRSLTSYFKPFSLPLLIYVENKNGRSNSLTFNYQF